MNGSEKAMLAIDYRPHDRDRLSLKQQLVAAVANGDEMVAEELRLLLKMNKSEQLPRRK